MNEVNNKKKHHYIPITYLDKFTDDSGRIFAYRKDGPLDPLHVKPRSIGFERYYYSQTTPDEKKDNNRLEDFFCDLESRWTPIVEKMKNGIQMGEDVEHFYQFMALQRARVPAARDAVELSLAALVRRQLDKLKAAGQLPPLPEKFKHVLNDIEISVDPHRSIHAIPRLMKEMAQIYNIVGFEILHNKTNISFITSDNPVAYYGRNRHIDEIVPYPHPPNYKKIEFIFPVTPKIIVKGSSKNPIIQKGSIINYFILFDRNEVRRINDIISKFAYRYVFSPNCNVESLVKKYADVSPITHLHKESQFNEQILPKRTTVFGKRLKKSKWSGENTKSK